MIQYVCKGKDMRKLIAAFAIVGFFVTCNPTMAEMTSTNYQIRWDSLTEGGSDTSTSTSYGIHDSVGGSALGNSTSTNYQTDSGYRTGSFDQVIAFNLLLQNTSDARIATARNGFNVSTTQTSGFSVGQYIVVVQDRGANQVSAIGKITQITNGISIKVDSWSYGSSLPIIDGTNDFIYPLNDSAIALGEMTPTAVQTAIIGFEVTADLQNGYSVQVLADGGLMNGPRAIPNVTDGSVTAGVEEYGARSSDTTLLNSTFDTQDTAITGSFQDIVTKSTAQYYDRNFLTLKVGVTAQTPTGTYTQAITLIASGNY